MARVRRICAVSVLGVGLAAVAACGVSGVSGVSGTGAATTANTATTKPATAAGSGVTLASAGTGAKQTLRLHLQPGARTNLAVKVTTNITQNISGRRQTVASPPIVEEIALRIVDVKDGVASYHFEVTGARLAGNGTLSAAQAQTVQASLRRLVGLTSDGRINDRGKVVASEVHIPSSVPSTLRQLMGQLDDQFDTLSVPLPEEAVGTGATWSNTSTATLSGARVAIRSEYRLTGVQGRLFTLAVTQHQTAKPQRFDLPTLPAGATARIVNWDITSTGTSALRLGNPFPAGRVHATGTQSFSISEGKVKPQTFTQDLSVDTEITDLGN